MGQYLVALRKLAGSCEFGQFLDEALRDRFVCGLKHEYIQKHLLSQKDLTLNKAVELAQGLEQASAQASTFHNPNASEVHKIQGKGFSSGNKQETKKQQRQKNPSLNSTPKCYRCGMRGHEPDECHFKNATCYKCNKKGHTSRVCTDKGKVHQVTKQDEEEEDTGDPEEGYLLKVGEKKEHEKPYLVTMSLDGKAISMEIDTGASHTVMTEEIFKESFPTKKLEKSSLTLKTYSGEEVKVLGMFVTEAKTNNQKKRLPVVVVKGENWATRPLMGRNWLNEIQLNWKEIQNQQEAVAPIGQEG